MAFAASRPDRALLARVPFGDDWLGLLALPLYGLGILFLATRTLRELD